MNRSSEGLESLSLKSLRRLKSSYAAVQILLIISIALSVVALVSAGFLMVNGEGIDFMLTVVSIWNIVVAALLWKRSSFGYFLAFVYLIPLIPSVLGLILFVMWFNTKPFFGKDRVTYRQVETAHARKLSQDPHGLAVPA